MSITVIMVDKARKCDGEMETDMNYIAESLHTPVTDECEVLIAGGGVAGIAAVLASPEGVPSR